MRGAIDLLGKQIEIDKTKYQIVNINFIPDNNNFYIELENNDGLLNLSLKDLAPYIKNQINIKNGSYRKEYTDSY